MNNFNDYTRFLGLSLDANYEEVAEELEKRVNSINKPCLELEYCPYGPLVEEFPIPPIDRKIRIIHNELTKHASGGLLVSNESNQQRKHVENKVKILILKIPMKIGPNLRSMKNVEYLDTFVLYSLLRNLLVKLKEWR